MALEQLTFPKRVLNLSYFCSRKKIVKKLILCQARPVAGLLGCGNGEKNGGLPQTTPVDEHSLFRCVLLSRSGAEAVWKLMGYKYGGDSPYLIP